MNKKVTIRKGARYTISQIGYYNFWYPSDEDSDVGVLSEAIDGNLLNWRGGGNRWIPLHVTAEIANFYGSPIRVIWIDKEEIQNG